MNNAGIVDCACKLNCVSPKTQNPVHAFSGDRVCVDLDECNQTVDKVVPNYTLLGKAEISLTPSSSVSLDNHENDAVLIKQSSHENHDKRNNLLSCGLLHKKNSDKNGGAHKISSFTSHCVCKTSYKWKFPMIVQKAWKHNRRVRLKSVPDINKMPLQRYQSHHSSSDEDWFEEIADDDINVYDEKVKTNYDNDQNTTSTNADTCSANFDVESNHIVVNKLNWWSPCLCSTFCHKPTSIERKIARRDSKLVCQIL